MIDESKRILTNFKNIIFSSPLSKVDLNYMRGSSIEIFLKLIEIKYK